MLFNACLSCDTLVFSLAALVSMPGVNACFGVLWCPIKLCLCSLTLHAKTNTSYADTTGHNLFFSVSLLYLEHFCPLSIPFPFPLSQQPLFIIIRHLPFLLQLLQRETNPELVCSIQFWSNEYLEAMKYNTGLCDETYIYPRLLTVLI